MGRVPVDAIDTHRYLSLPDNDLWERPYAVVRRLIDLVLSVVVSLPFLLLLPLLVLVIKLDSKGPVFLVQRRVGQHGREFDLLKLRTMRVGAEAEGVQFAARADPRITRAGKLLRATRLDEVPQLLNIARGEMSFIGPRPERPEVMSQIETQIPRFSARLLVKPGLTGWAQVKSGYACHDSRDDAQARVRPVLHQEPIVPAGLADPGQYVHDGAWPGRPLKLR